MAGGIYAVTTLNMEMLPRIEFPQTIIVAQWADAESSDQFLDEITVPLEEALKEVEGVVNLESTTSRSFAFIIVRNDFGENQDRITEDLKAAAASVELPEGVEPPEILNFSLSDLPVVVASASSGDLSLQELKEIVSNELQPRFEAIEEIDQVAISGGQELPDESLEIPDSEQEVAPEAEIEAVDPGRLPQVVIDGAKSAGLELEYAQDITPELLAGPSARAPIGG
jgi:HAE1 family hydrophobic/amphiphilic exporter-1